MKKFFIKLLNFLSQYLKSRSILVILLISFFVIAAHGKESDTSNTIVKLTLKTGKIVTGKVIDIEDEVIWLINEYRDTVGYYKEQIEYYVRLDSLTFKPKKVIPQENKVVNQIETIDISQPIESDNTPKDVTVLKPTKLVGKETFDLGINFGLNSSILSNDYATSGYTAGVRIDDWSGILSYQRGISGFTLGFFSNYQFKTISDCYSIEAMYNLRVGNNFFGPLLGFSIIKYTEGNGNSSKSYNVPDLHVGFRANLSIFSWLELNLYYKYHTCSYISGSEVGVGYSLKMNTKIKKNN